MERCGLFEDDFRIGGWAGLIAAGGEGDGGGEDERAAGPGEGAEVLAEQADAEPGAEGGLDVEEDASAGGGDVMDAPVPEQRGGGGAEQAADGEGCPGGGAEVGDGQEWDLVRSAEEGIEKAWAEDEAGQHEGSGEDGVSGDDGWAVGFHKFFGEQNPGQGGDEGGDDEEVAGEGRLTAGGGTAMATEDDEGSADRGTGEGEPAEPIEVLFARSLGGKEGSGGGEQNGHCADHERGVAYGGEGEAVELEEELDGDAEGGGEQQEAQFAGGEMEAAQIHEHDRQHAERGEEETVEHHVFDAHLVEGEAAEVKAGAPEGAGERAGAVAEERDAGAYRRGGLDVMLVVAAHD